VPARVCFISISTLHRLALRKRYENSIQLRYRQNDNGATWKRPEQSLADQWQWYSLLGFIVANLLALTFFLWLGGPLAVLRPGAILVEIKLLLGR
jgi:hypothetical protein